MSIDISGVIFSYDSIAWLIGGIGSLAIVVSFMTNYLNRRADDVKFGDARNIRKEFSEEINSLNIRIDHIQGSLSKPNEEEYARLLDEAYKNLKKDASDKILEELRADDARNQAILERQNIVLKQKDQTISRLREEILSLSRRGGFNLSIGVTITAAGIILLGYFVIQRSSALNSLMELNLKVFFIDFFPRLSLVILVEVFAFFFLNLYKTSLGEIKYFQNEVTSIEAKYIALQLAALSDVPEHMTSVIESSSKVERNFILSKNQTTIEIERARIEQAERMDVTSKLTDLFRSKK